jgi:hypothetical protein
VHFSVPERHALSAVIVGAPEIFQDEVREAGLGPKIRVQTRLNAAADGVREDNCCPFAKAGGMAEWSMAVVLKT